MGWRSLPFPGSIHHKRPIYGDSQMLENTTFWIKEHFQKSEFWELNSGILSQLWTAIIDCISEERDTSIVTQTTDLDE